MRINRTFVALTSAVAFIAVASASAMAAPPPPPPPSSTTALNQTVGQVAVVSGTSSSGNNAYAQGNAFQHATGNIGANIAAGTGNEQANSAFIDGPKEPTWDYTGGVTQSLTANYGTDASGSNSASVSGNAFQHASGNIGANVASGSQNQASNALAVLDTAGTVTSTTTQNTPGGLSIYDASGGNNAYTQGNAFQHASGNIGLNVAAGSLNQQSNSAVVMDSNLSTVSSTINQSSTVDVLNAGGGNSASSTGNAFQHASGNIGANVASGVGNQQANVLVVQP
jgi:hypothetical protein